MSIFPSLLIQAKLLHVKKASLFADAERGLHGPVVQALPMSRVTQ